MATSGESVRQIELDADHLYSEEATREEIESYQVTEQLNYTFENPGVVAVPQRPNPDIDPPTIDVSGPVWHYRTGTKRMNWSEVNLIPPLKALMQAFIVNKLETGSPITAQLMFFYLKRIHGLFNAPSDYPLSEAKVFWIMASLRSDPDGWLAFRQFYAFGEEEKVPGFTYEILAKLNAMKAPQARPAYSSIKMREHVFTEAEESALEAALNEAEPAGGASLDVPKPNSPDAVYTLAQMQPWFNLSIPAIAKNRATPYNNEARELLKRSYDLAPLTAIGKDAPCRSGVAMGWDTIEYSAVEVYEAAMAKKALRSFIYQRDNLMTHIIHVLAPRPSQLSGIDEDCLHFQSAAPGSNGPGYYSLDIPRRKKGLATKECKRRRIPYELGQKIERYLALKHALFGTKTGSQPLFIDDKSQTRLNETRAAERIKLFLNKAGLNRSAKSLRANVGQKLADMGCPAEVIAEILDHEDLSALRHYIQAALELSEIQDLALASHKGYMDTTGKLSGRIIPITEIKPEMNVVSGTVNRKLISRIGHCGSGEPCSLDVVYSCYQCDKFYPFDDLERHLKVLDALREEIELYVHDSADNGTPVKLGLSHLKTMRGVEAVVQEIISKQRGERK